MSRILDRGFLLGFVVALCSSCGAKDDSNTADSPSTDPTSTGTNTSTSTNKVSSVTSIGELKLSGALAITLPEAFGGGGSNSLRLLAGKKSREACMMGSTIKEEIRAVGEVAGFFCHLEAEKDRMKFGKKYKIMTPFGEFARIFVDNSKASEGKLTIGFCSNHQEEGSSSRSRQLITIDSLTDVGPKGSIITGGSGTQEGQEFSYGRSTAFDVSVSGVVGLVAKAAFGNGSNSFKRAVDLTLKNTDKSVLKLANKGSDGATEFFDRGVAFMGSEKGSAVFQTKGSFDNQTFQFSRRSFFSKSGDVLTQDAVDSSLQPALSDIPPYLPADFKPDAFTGWVADDCPTFDEEINLDPQSPAHSACEQDHGDDEGSKCWQSSDYEDSDATIDVAE